MSESVSYTEADSRTSVPVQQDDPEDPFPSSKAAFSYKDFSRRKDPVKKGQETTLVKNISD